jgi:hypothetical protein
MKLNRSVLLAFGLLILAASLYRVWDGRPLGFAPQIAMAIFAGAIIKNKKLAFILPLLSMFISDAIYQVLYINGYTTIQGFYEGQWQNYLLFGLLTAIGFLIKKINVLNVLVASIAAPTIYFILSNFIVWAGWQGTRGLGRPKTFEGLMMSYTDALPFYPNSIYATLIFSAIFFSGYFLVNKFVWRSKHQLA